MTDWLSRSSTPLKKLDYSGVIANLTALESAFAAIAQARAGIDRDFGTAASPPRHAQMGLLTNKAKTALAEAQRQIRDQFAQLQQDAAALRAEARHDFSTSADGRQYREALAGYGALMQHMQPEQLTERLADATAAGLVGEARALADLAKLKYPAAQGTDDSGLSKQHPTTALRLALWDADDKARTPQERAADDALSTVDVAARRFNLFSSTIDDRLSGVLEGRPTDPFAGNFTAQNIILPAEGGA